eukprot:TRINITY_DN30867_c0_g1_i1.p1 TRINITY_DN30867_c0_g1~~TRINITY_DN30867_c0_g1_i1.p1  ORF type:complete len:114 (+),score=2.10 TRINITY_DN30867_c0_g1_i1:33-344(+)
MSPVSCTSALARPWTRTHHSSSRGSLVLLVPRLAGNFVMYHLHAPEAEERADEDCREAAASNEDYQDAVWLPWYLSFALFLCEADTQDDCRQQYRKGIQHTPT